jgi:hypothetical protein
VTVAAGVLAEASVNAPCGRYWRRLAGSPADALADPDRTVDQLAERVLVYLVEVLDTLARNSCTGTPVRRAAGLFLAAMLRTRTQRATRWAQ